MWRRRRVRITEIRACVVVDLLIFSIIKRRFVVTPSNTLAMFRHFLFAVLLTCHACAALRSVTPSPPRWPSIWMSTGSAHYLFNNQTVSAQIFYDWTRPAQVMNLMREDTYTYAIFHNGTTVWRLERARQTCCIDPQQTGVTPPRPGTYRSRYHSTLTPLLHSRLVATGERNNLRWNRDSDGTRLPLMDQRCTRRCNVLLVHLGGDRSSMSSWLAECHACWFLLVFRKSRSTTERHFRCTRLLSASSNRSQL